MIEFTDDEVKRIKDYVNEIIKVQISSYNEGYRKGLEEGKRTTMESVTKIYGPVLDVKKEENMPLNQTGLQP